jgi:hypothetical protein
MKVGLSPLWRNITLRRHRSELRALRTARLMPLIAIFPIFLTVGGWYFLLAGIPSLVLFLLTQVLYGLSPLLGAIVFAVTSIIAIVALCVIAPWFFRWYFIAAGMMFGRMDMADRKEAALIAEIATAEASG